MDVFLSLESRGLVMRLICAWGPAPAGQCFLCGIKAPVHSAGASCIMYRAAAAQSFHIKVWPTWVHGLPLYLHAGGERALTCQTRPVISCYVTVTCAHLRARFVFTDIYIAEPLWRNNCHLFEANHKNRVASPSSRTGVYCLVIGLACCLWAFLSCL